MLKTARTLARLTAVTLVLGASAALAAETPAPAGSAPAPAASDVASVPGDDIFGFTTAADTGNPGDLQYFNENDGRVGKREGSYFALDQKFALGYTFAPNWWIGGAVFTADNNSSGVAGLPDLSRFRFDGASIELEYRILERNASNPFAVSLDVEPRWSLNDPETGLPSQAYQSTFKVFVDAPVRPDSIYWAGNLEFTTENAQVPGNVSQWAPSSQLLVSSALTYQGSPSLFIGGEVRYFAVFDDAGLGHEIGRALYVGPTLLWKADDKVDFNVTLQPQVYGRSAANPTGSLDLDDFERAQFRAKLVVNF